MKSIVIYCSIVMNVLLGLSAKADTIDNFQVYLKNEIVLRESDYNTPTASWKVLTLDSSNINDTFLINYDHCAGSVAGRKIVIWNGEDILFSRSFPDYTVPFMAIPLQELTGLYNIPGNTLEMRYYDDQVQDDGVLLAAMRVDRSITSRTVKQEQKDQPVLEWAVAAIMILVLLFLVFRKMTKKPA